MEGLRVNNVWAMKKKHTTLFLNTQIQILDGHVLGMYLMTCSSYRLMKLKLLKYLHISVICDFTAKGASPKLAHMTESMIRDQRSL